MSPMTPAPDGTVAGRARYAEWRVRRATAADIPPWSSLRADLWPEGTVAEHRAELVECWDAEGTLSLVAEGGADLVGFLEARLRSHADGCATSPVGYLEGWYVAPGWRRKGVGRGLVAEFERWGRAQGCRELASDTWPENAASLAAHRRLGFEEVDRVVTFRKGLDQHLPLPPSARPPLRWEES